ncbi:MAG: sensor histidine kinase [Ferrimicrobium sp.]|jgi:two-component sensor histidine kinase|nr:sensor histidine kinase [Ferrimicrobium sp.]
MLERDASSLIESRRAYLGELLRFWGFLADLGFSDLSIALPIENQDGRRARYTIISQVRPATSQTAHPGDLIGMQFDLTEGSPIHRCFHQQEIVRENRFDPPSARQMTSWFIPLRQDGEVFGVMIRDQLSERHRNPGELESTYLSLFDQFMDMMINGRFPYPPSEVEEAPRVGDGVCVLDANERLRFLSPNALSALHRLGYASVRVGMNLSELGLHIQALQRAAMLQSPVFEEVEKSRGVTVTFYCLPLYRNNASTGYVLLLRDVTDLRQRDRLLASKDATIREVHHRVKNNLQTISSLLSLQARRLSNGEAKLALGEAERRIRSIALVHEFLSRDVSEEVEIDEVIAALIHLARESKLPGRELEIVLEGSAERVDAQRVTPLAIVLAELIQNSLEHGYGADRIALKVRVVLERHPKDLWVEIADDGVGFPEDLVEASANSLGLAIVRDLVTTQLDGGITFDRARGGGALVRLRIPVLTNSRS